MCQYAASGCSVGLVAVFGDDVAERSSLDADDITV
jgi:TPP-dependent indolepyruvate ferredoxin oxidoreductase alpha subunit